MALIIYDCIPGQILANIRLAILASRVETWTFDAAGDFTHVPEQWFRRAWFRPRMDLVTDASNELVFGIVSSTKFQLTASLYGIYHGRFSEMLLTHFDDQFRNVRITALLDNRYDIIPRNS